MGDGSRLRLHSDLVCALRGAGARTRRFDPTSRGRGGVRRTVGKERKPLANRVSVGRRVSLDPALRREGDKYSKDRALAEARLLDQLLQGPPGLAGFYRRLGRGALKKSRESSEWQWRKAPLERIDALGKSPRHLNWLAPAHLREAEDEDLQALVAEAARELSCPIALVSLVLENIQFFKAHYGLPGDLRIARATDRDVSFCQFVVRDGVPFEVNQAAADERVPKDLVNRYGIQAYLGFPISTADHVVGSLCVIDTQPRTFAKSEMETMARLAALVSRRLDDMRAHRVLPSGALAAEASVPVFAELRNLMMPLSLGVQSLAVTTAEFAPLIRLARAAVAKDPVNARVLGALTDADSSIDDVVGLVADLAHATTRLSELLVALEKGTLMTGGYVQVAEVLESGALIADHLTRNLGGLQIRGASERRLRVARPTAVMAISGLLTLLARAVPAASGSSGIVAEIADIEEFVGITVSASAVDASTYQFGRAALCQSRHWRRKRTAGAQRCARCHVVAWRAVLNRQTSTTHRLQLAPRSGPARDRPRPR